jgi:hypothetical protein
VRKYYRLSDTGMTRKDEKVNEFADFVATMKILLDIEVKPA